MQNLLRASVITLMLVLPMFNLCATGGSKAPSEETLDQLIERQIREKGKIELDLYIMSKCSYAIRAEAQLMPILLAYKDSIKLNLYFIAHRRNDGSFASLNGDSEIEEDLIQFLIAQYYPDRLAEYLLKRSENHHFLHWSNVVFDVGIDSNEIKDRLADQRLTRLFHHNILKGQQRGINSSPSLFIAGEEYRGNYAISRAIPTEPEQDTVVTEPGSTGDGPGDPCTGCNPNQCQRCQYDDYGNCIAVNKGNTETCTGCNPGECEICLCDGAGACVLNNSYATCTSCNPGDCEECECDGYGACVSVDKKSGADCGSTVCVTRTCNDFGQCNADYHTNKECGTNTDCTSVLCNGDGNCVTTHFSTTTDCGSTDCVSKLCDGQGGCNVSNKSNGTCCGVEFECIDGECTSCESCCPELPVSLAYFRATNYSGEYNILLWKTASEVNNDYFLIEKSTNGLSFETLGKVDGAGTDIESNHYSFLDEDIVPGTTYFYRLKQVDFNEEFEYSSTISLNIKSKSNLDLELTSSQANSDHRLLSFHTERATAVQIKLINWFGQIILSKDLTSQSGRNIFNFETNGYRSGTYHIQVSTKDETQGTTFFQL